MNNETNFTLERIKNALDKDERAFGDKKSDIYITFDLYAEIAPYVVLEKGMIYNKITLFGHNIVACQGSNMLNLVRPI